MKYRILHFADLHLDTSFGGQGFSIEFGNERRLDLRAALTRILARARELKVDAVTIGGDFFFQDYLLPETIDFIHQQLALLAPIRVIIAPGGKDPFTNESPYSRLIWPENVDIFYQSKLTHLDLAPNITLWGASNPPARGQKLFDGFKPSKGLNILLMHAVQRISNDVHTINVESVQKAGFNLALLGGEHAAKLTPVENPFFIYPGSPEPLSSQEENDSHQVILVEINDEKLQIQTLSQQQWHYRDIKVDISSCISKEEVIRLIGAALDGEIAQTPHSAITVRLIGRPHIDLNLYELHQMIQTSAFYRLESHLSPYYDLEQLAREQTVRGLLVQRFLTRIRNAANETERCQQLTALNIALQALDGKQVSLYEIKTA
jgi:DNA repair exonuclease SbcCD nuclease subunit